MTSRILRLSDGTRVGLIEAGAGDPVLLLHGVGLCAQAWEPQLADLSTSYRLVAVDLPGHGASDALPDIPDLTDFVDWAARVIAALNLGQVAVVGHSMGALIAGGLAVDHAALVTRIALLNAVFCRSPDARRAVAARAEDIIAGTANPTAPLDRWFDASDTRSRDHVGTWLQNVSPTGYGAAYRAFALGDDTYADRFTALACPVLAMTADGDANSTPDMSHRMAAAAPLGRAVIVRGHRHMMPLTAPDRVNTELRHWMLGDTTPLAQGCIA